MAESMTRRKSSVWKMTESRVDQKSPISTRPLTCRSSSVPRRSASPSVVNRCTLAFPAGDGIEREDTNRPLAYIPPSFQGMRTLFTNNAYDLTRRASTRLDEELFPDMPPQAAGMSEAWNETPIRKLSQAVLTGIGNFLTSDTIRQTASTIFSSAARMGSQIVNKGLEVANQILLDTDYEDLPVKEDEMTCRGYQVKVHGEDLTLQSVYFSKTGLQVKVQLGSKLTTFNPYPPFSDAENNLILTFDGDNSIRVVSPSGTNLADINWDTAESGMLTLHL